MSPYPLTNPVARPHRFYGYQKELKKIVKGIAALGEVKKPFLIIGASGMGRTYLLGEIIRELDHLTTDASPEEYRRIFVPLSLDMPRINITAQSFFGHVADRLYERLPSRLGRENIPSEVVGQLRSIKTNSDPFSDPFALFCEKLEGLANELARKHPPILLQVVLLLDDLWQVQLQERRNLLPILRSLLTSSLLGDVITYVITCHYHDLQEVIYGDSPLPNTLIHVELHVYNREETLAYINDSTDNRMPYDVAEEIYIQTGGHPLLLEKLVSKLREENNIEELTSNQVSKAITICHKMPRMFDRLWDHLSETDLRVYGMLCQSEESGKYKSMSFDSLYKKLAGGVPAYNIQLNFTLRDSVRLLSTAGLIRECGEEDIYEVAGHWPANWYLSLNT